MSCVRQLTQKKYRERPSPPYSASDCPGKVLEGNDGRLYESRPNVKGVYAWRLYKDPKAAKETKTRRVSRKTSKPENRAPKWNVMNAVLNAAKVNLPPNTRNNTGIRKTFGGLFSYRTLTATASEVKYGGVTLLRDLQGGSPFKAGQTFRLVTLDPEDGTLRADQARRRIPLIA